jgi:hypothetical protein
VGFCLKSGWNLRCFQEGKRAHVHPEKGTVIEGKFLWNNRTNLTNVFEDSFKLVYMSRMLQRASMFYYHEPTLTYESRLSLFPVLLSLCE